MIHPPPSSTGTTEPALPYQTDGRLSCFHVESHIIVTLTRLTPLTEFKILDKVFIFGLGFDSHIGYISTITTTNQITNHKPNKNLCNENIKDSKRCLVTREIGPVVEAVTESKVEATMR
jgi:hypothetical protein